MSCTANIDGFNSWDKYVNYLVGGTFMNVLTVLLLNFYTKKIPAIVLTFSAVPFIGTIVGVLVSLTIPIILYYGIYAWWIKPTLDANNQAEKDWRDDINCNNCDIYQKYKFFNFGIGFGLIIGLIFLKSVSKKLSKILSKLPWNIGKHVDKFMGRKEVKPLYYGALITIFVVFILTQLIYDYKYYQDPTCASCTEIGNTEIMQLTIGLLLLMNFIPYLISPLGDLKNPITGKIISRVRNPVYLVLGMFGLFLTLTTLFQYYTIYEHEDVDEKCGKNSIVHYILRWLK